MLGNFYIYMELFISLYVMFPVFQAVHLKSVSFVATYFTEWFLERLVRVLDSNFLASKILLCKKHEV